MKNACLFVTLLMIFAACSGPKSETAEKKIVQTVQEPLINKELHPKLQEVLPQCGVIEFVFFVKGMEMSTETKGAKAINGFYNHIDSKSVIKQANCNYDNYEGSAVFRGREGDIKMTLDFVVTDPNCRFVKVVIDNKTYLQQLTDSGLQYFMQFMQMRTQPKPK